MRAQPSADKSPTAVVAAAKKALENCQENFGKIPMHQQLVLDSLALWQSLATPDTLLWLQGYNIRIRHLLNYNLAKTAEPLLQQYSQIIRGLPDSSLQWPAYHEAKGYWLYKSFRFKEALTSFEEGAAIAKYQQNQYWMHRHKEWIATLWQFWGRADSMYLAFDAYKYYADNGYYSNAMHAAKGLAFSFSVAGNLEKSMEYHQKALQLAQRLNDYKTIGTQQGEIADILITQGKNSEALPMVLQAQEQHIRVGFKDGIALNHLRRARIDMANNNLEGAAKWLQDAEKLIYSLNSMPLNMALATYKAQYSLKANEHAKADTLYAHALRAATQVLDNRIMQNAIQKAAEGLAVADSGKLPLALHKEEIAKEINEIKAGKVHALKHREQEALLALNPYTGALKQFDTSIIRLNHKELSRAEATLKLNQVKDTLRHITLEVAATRSKSGMLARVFWLTLGLSVIIGLVAWLQYRKRKKAEVGRQQLALLKQEVHHQVKNNLAVIARFIDVASAEAENPMPLADLQQRVAAISLLHQHLYTSAGTPQQQVYMQPYLQQICQAIINTHSTTNVVNLLVEAPVWLPVSIAEKLGLLVNELVTNSFKYAFATVKNPQLQILLHSPYQPHEATLVVTDNGPGMATQTQAGYGSRLIKGITHQLQGQGGYSLSAGTGCQYQINFAITPPTQ
ncbi:MAG TPA: sensor histidine kinase [Phnomibacter sp.]|nr:sensor histidine kinase [Phnomibacter sp.]